jgi:hypothetical protein
MPASSRSSETKRRMRRVGAVMVSMRTPDRPPLGDPV